MAAASLRVALDTTCLRRGPGGTAVYVERLADALAAAGVHVIAIADQRRGAPGGGGLASARNAAHDLRWRQRLAQAAQAAAADVLHHPLPAHAWGAGCPQVVTVHDLAFLEAPGLFAPAFRAWAGVEHRLAARRAGAVVCVSAATQAQVLARWGVAQDRVVVAHHGPGQWAAPVAEAGRRDEPGWFLYVGDAEPRKNLTLLLEGYRRYRAQAGDGPTLELVLAGAGLGGSGSGAVAGQPGVRVETGPDAARLRELHAGAAALVHPALLEGFGLTALEAMALGTPVLAVRSAALAEVCADAACYLPSPDAQALAGGLARLASEPALRARLSQAGRARAGGFSWAASARAHIEAYTLALSVSERTKTGAAR